MQVRKVVASKRERGAALLPEQALPHREWEEALSVEQLSTIGPPQPVKRHRAPVPVKERIRQILIKQPSARQSYMLAMFGYWLKVDGLAEALQSDDPVEGFRRWIASADTTSPKTTQNMKMEVQRERPKLDANRTARAWRDKQGRNGPVGA